VSGFDELKSVLKDHARFSSIPSKHGYPMLSPSVAVGKKSALLVHMDPPEHDVHRRAVMAEFTAKNVATFRPGIEDSVDRLLDAMATKGPPLDLVQALAAPVPAELTCNLLGLPVEDSTFFSERLNVRMNYGGDAEAAARADAQVREYFRQVVADRTRSPRDDLSSRLVVGHVQTGNLDPEAAARVLHVLLIGGFETTQNMISLGTITLLRETGQLEQLRREPSLWPSAIEELLRYLSVVHVEVRAATEDVEIDGQTIAAGEGVILLLGAANRDGRVFPEPDRFDVHRGDRHHVAFGFGVHTCLGQVVARVTLEAVFSRLFSRLPTLRLAIPMEELPFKEEMVIYGVHRLPVTWIA
jgi:pentalenic acid synthase